MLQMLKEFTRLRVTLLETFTGKLNGDKMDGESSESVLFFCNQFNKMHLDYPKYSFVIHNFGSHFISRHTNK